MRETWKADAQGVLVLPSGRAIRGRSVRQSLAPGATPDFALYLLSREPTSTPWPHVWVRWRDFGLPSDVGAFREALLDAWVRSVDERVEIACRGGRGRTGTALACFAVVDGVPAADAVAYVRQHYNSLAVETPWQRRFAARFTV